MGNIEELNLPDKIMAEDPPVRPTRLEISLPQVAQNLHAIRQRVGQIKVMGVVKANAYGHGIVEVAKYLEKKSIDYLGVAILEEGIALRKSGICSPILVFGSPIAEQIPYFLKYNLTITAPSVEKLNLINQAAEQLNTKAKVHLKIDTGMERIGTHWYSSEQFLEASVGFPSLEVTGIYSNFANADVKSDSLNVLQIERFLEALSFYPKKGLPMPMRHIANSGAILHFEESFLDMVRPGMLLYGQYPSNECEQSILVSPAMSWKTSVNYFKVVAAESPVSYGATWQSDKPIRMVTIPVGYGDGFPLSFSNKAEVIIRGHKFQVAGKVCMDQTMINIKDGSAYNGDEVVLLGDQNGESISVSDLANWGNTTPYEILATMNQRLPRVYINN